jgi:hypothetical protein
MKRGAPLKPPVEIRFRVHADDRVDVGPRRALSQRHTEPVEVVKETLPLAKDIRGQSHGLS